MDPYRYEVEVTGKGAAEYVKAMTGERVGTRGWFTVEGHRVDANASDTWGTFSGYSHCDGIERWVEVARREQFDLQIDCRIQTWREV